MIGNPSQNYWGFSVLLLSGAFLSSSLVASLNSLIPEPKPLINSGIFLAPNNKITTKTIKTISRVPIALKIYAKFILTILGKVTLNLVSAQPHFRILFDGTAAHLEVQDGIAHFIGVNPSQILSPFDIVAFFYRNK